MEHCCQDDMVSQTGSQLKMEKQANMILSSKECFDFFLKKSLSQDLRETLGKMMLASFEYSWEMTLKIKMWN